MYCLTVRDVHNNGRADNYFFETLEEADKWSNVILTLFENKVGFVGYQWDVIEVTTAKVSLDEYMECHGLNKCGNTSIACPQYTDQNHDYCHLCRS